MRKIVQHENFPISRLRNWLDILTQTSLLYSLINCGIIKLSSHLIDNHRKVNILTFFPNKEHITDSINSVCLHDLILIFYNLTCLFMESKHFISWATQPSREVPAPIKWEIETEIGFVKINVKKKIKVPQIPKFNHFLTFNYWTFVGQFGQQPSNCFWDINKRKRKKTGKKLSK